MKVKTKEVSYAYVETLPSPKRKPLVRPNFFLRLLIRILSEFELATTKFTYTQARMEEAKDKDRKLITFSVFTGVIIAGVMAASSLFFPSIYNVTDNARSIASFMLIVSGLTMPFLAFSNAAYFTLRSGGKVLITILFDSVYMWAVVMPTALICAYLTGMNIFYMFIICQGVDVLKCFFGALLLKHGGWEKMLVNDEKLKA